MSGLGSPGRARALLAATTLAAVGGALPGLALGVHAYAPQTTLAGQAGYLGVEPQPGDDPVSLITWDFGDGQTGTGMAVRHTWASPGAYRIRARISSPAGERVLEVGVVDVRPAGEAPRIARVGVPETAVAGAPVLVTPDVAPGSTGRPVIQIQLTWGDGSRPSAGGAAHTYRRPGTYRVRVQATDSAFVRSERFAVIRITVGGTTQPRPVGAQPAVSPRVLIGRATRSVRAGDVLRVGGRLRPGHRGRLVQLEWQDGQRWRPIVQARTRADGGFDLTYRVRGGPSAYQVRLRVRAPGETGQGAPDTASRGFVVTIRPRMLAA